jgi:C1A family cysteine protease
MGVYALARKRIGWLNRDSGCFIRDAAYQISNIGICLESFHPFKMDYLYRDLDLAAVEQCGRHKITNIRRVDRTDFEQVLADHKMVVGGITVYQECVFGEEAQRTGHIRLPRKSDTFGGGHALAFAGYDHKTGLVTGPNSWGNDWGDNGWFSLSLDYIKNSSLSDDFWTFDVA